jgi:hypothetical protein
MARKKQDCNMSDTPASPKQWAQEVQSALQMALKLLEEDKGQSLVEEQKSELFKYAPVLAAYNRNIRDENMVMNMAKFAFKRRLDDKQLEGDDSAGNNIHFYLAYLDAHVAIDELNEPTVDSIMEYLIGVAH